MTRQLLQWSQSMMHLLTDLGKWQGLGGSSLQWHRSIMVNMSSFVLISLGPWYTSAPMKPVKQALPHSMLPQPAVIDTKPARMPQLPFIESLQAAAFPTAFRLLIYIIWIICHISSYYIYAHSWVDLYTELQIHSQVHQDMHSTFSSSNRTVQSCGMCHPSGVLPANQTRQRATTWEPPHIGTIWDQTTWCFVVVIFLLGVLGEAELIGDMNFLPPGKLGTGTPEGLHSELNLFLLGKGMSTYEH